MHALVLPFDGKEPRFGKDVFLAPTCTVIGDVVIGDRASLWYGSVVRGDVNMIRIGDDTNIQDAAVLHGTLGEWPVILGERVSVGHSAVLHGCVIEDDVLVGIGARILDGTRIGAGSLIAAGALVREGTVVPPRSLVVGVPAVVKRELTERELDLIRRTPGRYLELARQHRTVIAQAARGIAGR